MAHDILLLADIHVGQPQPNGYKPGEQRQANHIAEEKLRTSIPYWNAMNFAAAINFGDVLNEVKPHHNPDQAAREAANVKNAGTALDLISTIEPATINIAGNHDLSALGREAFVDLLTVKGMRTDLAGTQQIGDYRFVWFDYDMVQREKFRFAVIGNERLAWLKAILGSGDNVILLSHYPVLRPSSMAGNFLFETFPQGVTYMDQPELLEIVSSSPSVVATVSAHVHEISYESVGNKHFIGVPSFSDNIAGMDYRDNNPAVYTVMTLEGSKMRFVAYSGKYAMGRFTLST